jgi:histidinol dehydrogenase
MSVLRILDARTGHSFDLVALRERSFDEVPMEVEEGVRTILKAVRERGDDALVEYTQKLDCPGFTKENIIISQEEIEAAYSQVTDKWLGAFRRARENVWEFQQRAKQQSWLESFDGLQMGNRVSPVASAGLYVPAKLAPLPSSLLMTAIPARVAGVERVVFVTPPRPDGTVEPTMLVAAAECGVDEAYRVGGAQAIGALAYGTESIEPVVKIVGPGSPWVTVAKKQVFGVVGIESIAGPSESLIIADCHASPELVAADLLTQAEHTGDNTVILLSDSEALINAVEQEIMVQLSQLSRCELTQASLEQYGIAVICRDIAQAIEISNDIAPEHLQIVLPDPFSVLELIQNAGCIFMGYLAPVPLGDYAAGPSHVLPTYGTARFSSPLSANDFLKVSSVIYATERGFQRLADDVAELADHEGLTAHAAAIRRRQKSRSCSDCKSKHED